MQRVEKAAFTGSANTAVSAPPKLFRPSATGPLHMPSQLLDVNPTCYLFVLGAILCVYTAFGSRTFPKLLWLRRRWGLLLAFGLNVACVAVPGRFGKVKITRIGG